MKRQTMLNRLFLSFRIICFACLSYMSSAATAGIAEGIDAFNKFSYTQARTELEDLAIDGNATAMAYMGEMFIRGQGGDRNELKGLEYLQKAHEGKELRAAFTLATLYMAGNVVAKDEARGVEMIKKAAELSEPNAQGQMAAWIFSGQQGYGKEPETAVLWAQACAAQNNSYCLFLLGYFNEEGIGGLKPDQLLAIDWFRKSAEKYNTSGMTSLGRIYAVGRGVTPDGEEAMKWLRRAALNQSFEAYMCLSYIYENGANNVTRNRFAAYAWLHAVPNNAPAYVTNYVKLGKERLAKLFSTSEIQEAERNAMSIVYNNHQDATLDIRLDTFKKNRVGVSGSGVVVSRLGYVLTNEHVVEACSRVRIQPSGETLKLVSKDARNDLAVLKFENANAMSNLKLLPTLLRENQTLSLGEAVTVFGYPLPNLLSPTRVLTTGVVNALSGTRNDTSEFQMSATVQPGSSGGPVFDNAGLLIGLVKARLLPSAPANPQNINFAIK